MLRLRIPERLKAEFATVLSLWQSSAETRRTDCLLLAWVKYEKQLRRLFCFLVFQHPAINEDSLQSVITAMAESRRLNPDTFLMGIKELRVEGVAAIMGPDHSRLWPQMLKIKEVRNKLMHGQVTGQGVRSPELERHVRTVVEWVDCLARAADAAYGYDGLKRNTFRAAKSAATIEFQAYPFQDASTFRTWLTTLANATQAANQRLQSTVPGTMMRRRG